MLLQGSITSNKTEILVENYAKLLNSGVDSSRILVILQNSNKKNQFIQETLEKLTIDVLEKLQVYSFFGLVYNTISDNWVTIENQIPDDKNTKIIPNLTGLEVSQFIMREIISEIKFEGYNSKKSLLHQLFRRYSLIVQNNLDDKGVKWRSEGVLGESFAPDAKKAIDEFKWKTLEARGLDYLRQSLIFNHIYKTTDYFSKIEYLIVDDADEITPICLDFIKFLAPQLKDVFIAYDELGASRSGYLSADKAAGAEFEKLFGIDAKCDAILNEERVSEVRHCEERGTSDAAIQKATSSHLSPLTSHLSLSDDAQTIFDNVIEQKNEKMKHFSLSSLSKRAQMLDVGTDEIKTLINNGVKPSEISIVTPIIDDMLRFSIKDKINGWMNPLFLSGSEKIIQNPIVLASLNILKLCDDSLKQDLSEYDVRAVLQFMQIPLKHCKEILDNFEKTKSFITIKFPLEEYSEKYNKFLDLLTNLSNFEKLSEQVYEIYENLVEVKNFTPEELTKFNFFIKQLEDFESVFGNIKKADIINQIENSIISENPYSTLEIQENDLVIATPQKIIDNQIRTKYQFWFDVSSDEWIKNDTGPLYNAWVFQAGWEKDEYTLQDNIELGRQKTARILRKLTLCAKEKINAYASLFDGSGIENFGGIEKYLSVGKEVKNKIISRPFTPRDDQKPVLEYKKGKMAISAVPGAGKTTILLALIIKLMNDGINPENIFVLTYMESAARNFRERIQNANQEFSQLPNISTIHGLALKILKENANFEKLGLNADFEICDDTQRSRILREIGAKFDIKKTELEDFDRAVSVLKIGGGSRETEQKISRIPSPPEVEGKGGGQKLITHLYTKQALEYAKELRLKKNMTEAENTLWYYLRNEQMAGVKFRKQSPIGNYIVDFISFEKNLIIELDGGQHLETSNVEHDKKRDNFLEDAGFKVLRFFNNEVFENITGVLESIYNATFNDAPHSPPPLQNRYLIDSLGRVPQVGRESADAPLYNISIKEQSKTQKAIKLHSPLEGESELCSNSGGGQKNAQASDKKLTKFMEFFKEYKAVLQSNNLIDYDDMLLFSVQLLEENPDVLSYYQEICRYIIEDEAQDSSEIQQRLIELLSAKHQNLIRCGDINQAITTTFSNADVEGFRRFIQTSQTKVSMDRSQRCTKDVWALANSLIAYAETKPETKNAFYKIYMKPVEGKNPDEKKAITPVIFENEFVEKNYILKQIKSLLTKNPKATVGILLRSNFQVGRWLNFINNAGMKAITRSECLEQKGIFRTIFAIMKIIEKPFNNENIADNYDILAELGHYKSNLYQTIKNCEKPFIEMKADDIANPDLCEFYWDLIYWLNMSSLSAEELAIKIGIYYYNSSEIEKSNVYLISTLIKRLGMSYKKYSTLIERLGELAKKPNLSGFKFFSEEDKSDREFLAGKVQIMTLHKSKGDEFDYVFLPEMAEKSLPLAFENVSLKKNARFMESVRELNENYPQKTDDELREFLLAENLRLFYVAVTRAKRKLFITANKSAKYNKVPEPSVIFEELGVVNEKH